jgi:hypothetical protein
MPNIQLQQFINLLLVCTLGYFSANMYLSWYAIGTILLVSFFSEHILVWIKEKKIDYFSYSSLTTSIGVVLMMVSTDYLVYFVVIIFALVQKHFLRLETGHLFNPSNFALIMGLLIFYDKAHIVLGQLGDALWLLYVVLLMGVIILWQAKRWIISLCFVLFYLCFQYILIVSTDPLVIFEDIYERFYSISFIVFVLFMLTDPRTTPFKVGEQIVFSFFLAGMSTSMDFVYGFRIQHLFLVLFLGSAFYALFVRQKLYSYKDKMRAGVLFILVLSVIIFIQIQEPYYFEMD